MKSNEKQCKVMKKLWKAIKTNEKHRKTNEKQWKEMKSSEKVTQNEK